MSYSSSPCCPSEVHIPTNMLAILPTTYLPTYLPQILPTYLSTYLPASLPTYRLHGYKVTMLPFSGKDTYQYANPFCLLPTYPPTFLPTYLSTYLPTCLPTYRLHGYKVTMLPFSGKYTYQYACHLAYYLPTHLPSSLPPSLPTYPPTYLPPYLPTGFMATRSPCFPSQVNIPTNMLAILPTTCRPPYIQVYKSSCFRFHFSCHLSAHLLNPSTYSH